MRSTLILSTVLAPVAVAVSAETNCNPSYNVPTSSECFTNCNVKAGAKFLQNGFTMDPTSPYFLDSLKLMCTKGTSEYTAFMTQGGMCMTGCKDDPMLFADEFAAACTWYAEHKNDECASDSTKTNSTATAMPDAIQNNASSSVVPDAAQTEASTTTTPDATETPATTETVPTDSADDMNLAVDATSAANKLQLSGYALALIAGVGYLGL